MKDKIRLVPTCSPEETELVRACGIPWGLTSYGIWKGHLHHQHLPKRKFSVMCIDGSRFGGEGSHRVLTSEIVREAIVRGCKGVLLDLSPAPPTALSGFCRTLNASCEANGITLYLPERFASLTESACALIRTSLCAGSFKSRLEEASKAFSPSRLALDAEIMRAEFTLPASDGAGRFIEEDELDILRSRFPVFHSEELAANYMINFSGDSIHFILFDDKNSFSTKLSVAENFGIKTAFMRYSDYEYLCL